MRLNDLVRAVRRSYREGELLDIEYRARQLHDSLLAAGLRKTADNMDYVLRSLEWEGELKLKEGSDG